MKAIVTNRGLTLARQPVELLKHKAGYFIGLIVHNNEPRTSSYSQVRNVANSTCVPFRYCGRYRTFWEV